jgi:hypothetical protein
MNMTLSKIVPLVLAVTVTWGCGEAVKPVTPRVPSEQAPPAEVGGVKSADVRIIEPQILGQIELDDDIGFGGRGGLVASNGYLLAPGHVDAMLIEYSSENQFGKHQVMKANMAMSSYTLDHQSPPHVWSVGFVQVPGSLGVNIVEAGGSWDKSQRLKIRNDWRFPSPPLVLDGTDQAMLVVTAPFDEFEDDEFPVPESRWDTEIYRLQSNGAARLFLNADKLRLNQELPNLGASILPYGEEFLVAASDWGNGYVLRVDQAGQLLEQIKGPAGVHEFGSGFRLSADQKKILAYAIPDGTEDEHAHPYLGSLQTPRRWVQLKAPSSIIRFALNGGFLPTPDGEVIYISSFGGDMSVRYDFYDPNTGNWIAHLKMAIPKGWKSLFELVPLSPGVYAMLLSNYKDSKVRLLALKCF